MTRGDYFLAAIIILCWAAYLLGIDDIPGWQGIGRGLLAGSLVLCGILIWRLVRSFKP